MEGLCGSRASRLRAWLIAPAVLLCCCWIAQGAGGPAAGGIRVLKGTQWFEDWQPLAADACQPPGVVELKGTHYGNLRVRPQHAATPAGNPLFPTLDFTPAKVARPGEVWADMIQKPVGAESSAPPVTVLVLPTIIQAPARAEPSGGAEASETHLATSDESATAARRAAQAARRDDESAVRSADTPEPRNRPAADGGLYTVVLVHFVSTAAAVIVALAAFCGGLLLLRRLGVALPLGAWPTAPGESATAAPIPELTPEALTNFDLASNFDLGPTYAEEMRRREDEVRQREEAVLRHIFEQNLRLREQIDELEGPAE
jgi:hypothetical protein